MTATTPDCAICPRPKASSLGQADQPIPGLSRVDARAFFHPAAIPDDDPELVQNQPGSAAGAAHVLAAKSDPRKLRQDHQ